MNQPHLNRGLHESFVDDLLTGEMAAILHAAKESRLDLQIRDNYTNAVSHC